MTDVPDLVRVAVVAPIGNSDHSSPSAVISMAQAVPNLCVSRKVFLTSQQSPVGVLNNYKGAVDGGWVKMGGVDGWGVGEKTVQTEHMEWCSTWTVCASEGYTQCSGRTSVHLCTA